MCCNSNYKCKDMKPSLMWSQCCTNHAYLNNYINYSFTWVPFIFLSFSHVKHKLSHSWLPILLYPACRPSHALFFSPHIAFSWITMVLKILITILNVASNVNVEEENQSKNELWIALCTEAWIWNSNVAALKHKWCTRRAGNHVVRRKRKGGHVFQLKNVLGQNVFK